MKKFVGVDFGTSTTLVARMRSGVPEVVNLADPSQREDASIPWLPSVVETAGSGDPVVRQAGQRAIDRVIRSAKQAITRNEDFVQEGDSVSANAAIRAILSEVRLRATAAEDKPLERATVRLGCPAMWDATQRKRLLDIALAAGLKANRAEMIDEPIAAGASWIADEVAQGREVNGRVLVVDYGGGTLDVAVLDVASTPKGIETINVMSADSFSEAGDAIDELIANDVLKRGGFTGALAGRTPSGGVASGALRRGARELKEALTTKAKATVDVDTAKSGVEKISYDREAMDAAVAPLLERGVAFAFAILRAAILMDEKQPTISEIRALTPEMLASGTSKTGVPRHGYTPRPVDYVLLSGGTSYMPAVEDHYRESFPSATIVRHPRPQEAVALGLALDSVYDSMNLFRPGFDIVRIDADGAEETLYEANDPLYARDQVWRGEFALGLRLPLACRTRDKVEEVTIQFRDSAGKPQDLVSRTAGEAPTDGIKVTIGPAEGGFIKLSVHGQLKIVTGDRRTMVLGVVAWPAPFGDVHGFTVEELPSWYRSSRPGTGGTPGEPG